MRSSPLCALLVAAVASAGVIAAACGGGDAGDEPFALVATAPSPSPAPSPAPTPAPSASAPITPACSPPPAGVAHLLGALAEYPKLSSFCLFTVTDDGALVPRPDAVPYELNSPLFSDYTLKSRVLWLPKGTRATYSADEVLSFPVGTIIAKTFAYADDLRAPTAENTHRIETRLLVRHQDGWVALPYVWDADRKDATLAIPGALVPLTWTHTDGAPRSISYTVPDGNQCKKCHELNGAVELIGPKARNLNRDFDYPEGRENQLARLARLGLLEGAPPPAEAPRLVAWDDEKATIDARARSWIEINCAHCHRQGGTARTSALFLMADETDPGRYGICKSPVAAGSGSGDLKFDISPGKPEESIFIYRMLSDDPKEMMPELGRAIEHAEGIALVSDWIKGLPGDCESAPPTPTTPPAPSASPPRAPRLPAGGPFDPPAPPRLPAVSAARTRRQRQAYPPAGRSSEGTNTTRPSSPRRASKRRPKARSSRWAESTSRVAPSASTRPRSSRTARGACAAKATSCTTARVATPSAARARSRAKSSERWATSRCEVGSSSSKMCGSWARARARATRCRSPPESEPTRRSPRAAVFVSAMARSTASSSALVVPRQRPRCGRRPRRTTSRAKNSSGRASFCTR
ncbi:MAG TPA: SO2930 family diheme c-type cytochrome [Polyangiaceae bacterium]|nr:SO2930 family diheme c-type cytochrome [Polyangiaceae bacterium]